jgi:hypothetical protein
MIVLRLIYHPVIGRHSISFVTLWEGVYNKHSGPSRCCALVSVHSVSLPSPETPSVCSLDYMYIMYYSSLFCWCLLKTILSVFKFSYLTVTGYE